LGKKKITWNFKLQKVVGTRQIAKANNGKRQKAMAIRQKQTMVKVMDTQTLKH
jgi:hypothetical protein